MYFYHAHAVALGGVVERPSPQTIDAQASCALSVSGGTSCASASKFDNGLISFDSAQSSVTGSAERVNGNDVYYTGSSVIINNISVAGIFKADQIVARITCEHMVAIGQSSSASSGSGSAPDEPTIRTTGSHFDNLRIAGYPVDVDMAHEVFDRFPTFQGCCNAWNGQGGSTGKTAEKTALHDCLLGKTIPEPRPGDPAYPEHLQTIYDGFKKQSEATNLRPTVLCSFVKKVNGINSGEISNWGPIIKIPQFGTIYLGEVILRHGQRHLNMFRLQLGSPQAGGFVGGSTGGNGTSFP